MDAIVRAAAVYLFLWLMFRLAGKRTLAQITTFDALLLLIISEAVQGALLNDDNSLINAFLIIVTLVGLDVGLSYIKEFWPGAALVLDGQPVILFGPNGVEQPAMARERIDREDILAAARTHYGLSNLDDVQYAILEESGGISIIPYRPG